MKSTIQEIRERFDNNVERFSNIETGQSATVDALLVMELVTKAAAANNPDATRILDIGCGAGNYTLKLLKELPTVNVTLVDISKPMLDKANQRIQKVSEASIEILNNDIRDLEFKQHDYDIVVAAATLHHLRNDDEWVKVFKKIYQLLNTGGSFWISDLIAHSNAVIQEFMWQRYGNYLSDLRNDDYREKVFSYIEKEDTPRPLYYQLDLLKSVGFRSVDILHKNSCFAAFGAIK